MCGLLKVQLENVTVLTELPILTPSVVYYLTFSVTKYPVSGASDVHVYLVKICEIQMDEFQRLFISLLSHLMAILLNISKVCIAVSILKKLETLFNCGIEIYEYHCSRNMLFQRVTQFLK